MVSAALQVDRVTQHMEASERSMHNRIQRLEAIRISLEEVRKNALGTLITHTAVHREGCQESFVESPTADLCKDGHVL